MNPIPFEPEAEKSVIGCILTDNGALLVVQDVLGEGDFHERRTRELFRGCLELDQAGRSVDALTLAEQTDADPAFVVECLSSVPSAANAAHYAQIVRDAATRRAIIQTAQSAIEMASREAGVGAGKRCLDFAQMGINGIPCFEQERRPEPEEQVMGAALDQLEACLDSDCGVTGLPTGLAALDDQLGGLQPSELVVLAGRPGMGKTALGMDLAARGEGEGAGLFFSFEMSPTAFGQRRLSQRSGVSSHAMRRLEVTDEDMRRLYQAREEAKLEQLQVVESRGMSVLDLRTRARRFAAERDLAIIVIDYLQLLRPPPTSSRNRSRDQAVGEISAGLLDLASELRVPVVALAQLNRECDKRDDKRPVKSDLRDSGNIEQDADTILFVYRDSYYRQDAGPEAEIIVAKQRMGPEGTVRVLWDPEATRFYEGGSPGAGQPGLFPVPVDPRIGTIRWVVQVVERVVAPDGLTPLVRVSEALVNAGLPRDRATDYERLEAVLRGSDVARRFSVTTEGVRRVSDR